MKHLIIILGILSINQVFAQNFKDGFSDGNFSTNPTWSGADSNFVIADLAGNNVLRLNDNEAGISYLSTPSTEITGFWEFFIRIDGTAPSGSNKAEIIIMSDIADLSGLFNGYGIRLGQTGNDVFHLVRYDAGSEAETVISDTTIFQAGGSYRLKVNRDASGNWAIEVGEGYNGNLKNSGNSAIDNTYTTASFLGVKATYTSSRTDDFYFDFSIDSTKEETDTTIVFDSFEPGDILINEFLKDPATGSGLSEYIELVNISNKTLNLKDWQIGDNSSLRTISDSNYVFLPDTFLVLTSNPEALVHTFGPGNYLDVSLPALNNTSDQIRLFTSDDVLVDSLEYSPDWGGVDVAVERRSLEVEAILQANWGDSPNEDGGTPGAPNEIEPDTSPPEIESWEFINDSLIQVVFSEAVKMAPAQEITNYSLSIRLDNDVQAPVVARVDFLPPDTVNIHFDIDFTGDDDGENYALNVMNLEDVFGNISSNLLVDFSVYYYEEAGVGEVALNEFMYDPADDFSEFVELYNPTYKNFNLQGWTFYDNTRSEKVLIETQFILRAREWVILVPDSTIPKNFGLQNFIHVSGFPSLNNTSDDLVLRNAQGVVIDSLTYSSAWGGDEVSLERRSVDFTATLQANWGDSPSESFGTPGTANLIAADNSSPGISSFEIRSDSTIRIIFTEEIEPENAEVITNYGLTNPKSASAIINRPTTVSFYAPDSVELTFEQSFFEENLLEILNQTDVFGNQAEVIRLPFEYVLTQPVDVGDVAINEFMYDPIEGFSEFVEMVNHSSKNFNIRGWSVADNSGNPKVLTQKDFYLKSGEYLVLAPDSTIFESIGNIKLLEVSGFPALNNTVDQIQLFDAEGSLLDSLQYSSEWGGNEVSLERRRTDIPAIYEANWGDSPSPSFGTPGAVNEIEQDEAPPKVINVQVLSSREIVMVFDEVPVGDEVLNPENYYAQEGPNPISVSSSADTVTLQYDTDFEDGQAFELIVRNISDIFDNVQLGQTLTVLYVEVVAAKQTDVVISEILYRRADELSPEFVELFNRSESNFDLAGWSLTDAGTNTTHIPSGTYLNAGEYLVLTDREEFAATGDHILYVSDFPSLNDAGDALILKNSNNLTIDSLYYQAEWGGDEPGVSLERKDAASASNDASNWATNSTESGNSAAVQNSVFEEDVSPPEIIFSTRIDSAVKVVFSEFVQLTPSTSFFVNEQESNVLFFDENKPNELVLQWQTQIQSESGLTKNSVNSQAIRIQNISDVKGNSVEEIAGIIALKLEDYPVVINEIMFDPLANSEDNLPDQTEYIELYNPHSLAVSLEGIKLHDAPDEDGEVREIAPVSTTYRWIPAHEYALIYAEDEGTEFAESRLAQYFGIEEADDRFALRVDRSSLSLGSSGDAIYLADSTGAIIDSVYFEETWQNPNLYATDGIALELIDPGLENNQATNWSSSTHVSGGTPLAQNSIFQEAGEVPENIGIHFSPNPFSPDGDGFEDNLFMNYTLDAPDYLLRVRIFDRYGREVRELVQGEAAGFEGSLIWDGLTDNDRRNRVGMYIVFFEAYNSSTGQDRTFKETVVIARKF